MKKIYSLLAFGLVAFSMNTANAQCTVADPNKTTAGVAPSPLPASCATEMYDEDVQVTFKKDSTLASLDTPLGTLTNVYVIAQSVTITSITGLPDGVTHSCEDNNCTKTLDGQAGYLNTCLNFAGTPTTESSGEAMINLEVTVESPQAPGITEVITKSFPVGYTVNAAGSCQATSIDEAVETGFSVSPNPIASSAVVNVSLASAGDVELKVFDFIGKEVASSGAASFGAGSSDVDGDFISSLDSGVYIVKLYVNGTEASGAQKIVRK